MPLHYDTQTEKAETLGRMKNFAIATILALLAAGIVFGQNPETAVFPGAVLTDSDSLVALNGVSTTLSVEVTSTIATEFTVTSSAQITAFPTGCWVDSEIVKVTGKASAVLTVVRGYNGTSAATHLVDAPFTCGPIAKYDNQQNAELKAMQALIVRCDSTVELTISGGAITIPSSACYTVDTELDAADDDLTLINCPKGVRFVLTPADGARTVRIVDDDVNIDIQANFSLNYIRDSFAGLCFDTNVVIEEDRTNAGT